MNIEIK